MSHTPGKLLVAPLALQNPMNKYHVHDYFKSVQNSDKQTILINVSKVGLRLHISEHVPKFQKI